MSQYGFEKAEREERERVEKSKMDMKWAKAYLSSRILIKNL